MRFHDPGNDFGFQIGDRVRSKKDPAWWGVVNTYDETQDDLHITDQNGEDFWSKKQGWERAEEDAR